MAGIERLTRERSISVRIAEQILGLIESGDFPVGTKLPSEMELARRLGVSRPTVREALGALQFAGHVDSVRGSGTRVVSITSSIGRAGTVPTQLTAPAVLDLFEARLLVEPQVAALAAENPVPGRIGEAEAVLKGMRLVVHEPSLHVQTDLSIHRAVAEICPNIFMRRAAFELLDSAATPALEAVRAQTWDERLLPPVWGSQHDDVLRAIRARDAEAAAAASWAHLVSTMLNALESLAEDPEVEEAAVARLQSLAKQEPPAVTAATTAHPEG